MEANNIHISLETAKLLKDCGIESNYVYDNPCDIYIKLHRVKFMPDREFYPAFTWQEILWEYPERFFAKNSHLYNKFACGCDILEMLQQKKYEEADLYFREHCILI